MKQTLDFATGTLSNAPLQHVRSYRDEPPFGDWCARVILIRIRDGKLEIATVFDADPRKLGRCLPGGRQNKEREGGLLPDETPLMTVRAETHEECGVPLEIIRYEDFYPVCEVARSGAARRNSFDQETGTLGTDLQHIFVRWGDFPLSETDDLDTEDPRWQTLEEIIRDAVQKKLGGVYKIYEALEKDDDHPERKWHAPFSVREGGCPPQFPFCDMEIRKERVGKDYLFLSHIVILVSAINIIGEEFRKYYQGVLTDECDLEFFRKLARETDVTKNPKSFEAVCNLFNVDLLNIVTDIVGTATLAEVRLAAYKIKQLGGGKYFLSK